MDLLVLNGGPRKTGRTKMAASFIEKTYNANTFDLSEKELPLFNGDESRAQLQVIQELKKAVSDADAVVLLSPEYHNGMSGALKNALDFLSSEQFSNKPVAIISVAGGGKGGINALNNMRTVMRGVYAHVIPKQVVLDPHCFNYDQKGLVEESATLVHSLIKELMLYTEAFQKIS
ncbi:MULTISPECIES: NADPH-dependent FMN reductase [Bacillaceae]|uniref:NADPH-dependent FMN reductase n=1 Tax=Bacillaceae TaxID=186817 RepID=UPI000BFDD046|nr:MULTISPECIES: NADPH-dependent FMN reductase [Bacillaceae]PGT80735.1 FMN-dependent NADH-azoreductase [Bacillus sp. AFS040349]UGB31544.1 NAD(P)H-dependent oxidoreductase [Metabacillus sp. B2-18]